MSKEEAGRKGGNARAENQGNKNQGGRSSEELSKAGTKGGEHAHSGNRRKGE